MSDLEDVIEAIKLQPGFSLHCRYHIKPLKEVNGLPVWDDLQGVNHLFGYWRKAYKAVGEWLEYYLLDKTELASDLTFTDKVNYKPDAEILVAFYRLAQEVWLHYQDPECRSPAFWMFLCHLDLLEMALEDVGYLSKPNPVGKTERYRAFVSDSKIAFDLDSLSDCVRGEYLASPHQFLLDKARDIAMQDSKFEEEHWLPFWQKMKQCSRNKKNSKFAIAYLDGKGNLRAIEKGKRSKQIRGFG
jgi:hypothetical protein